MNLMIYHFSFRPCRNSYFSFRASWISQTNSGHVVARGGLEKKKEPLERCVDGIIAALNRLESRLKAKCARRRCESAVLFKNEHAAQARVQWQVRGGRAGPGGAPKTLVFHRRA